MKTIKVMPWGAGQGAFVEMNQDEFDPAKHQLYTGPVLTPQEAAARVSDPATMDRAALLDAVVVFGRQEMDKLSDDQLRSLLKDAQERAEHEANVGSDARDDIVASLVEGAGKGEPEHDDDDGHGLKKAEIVADLEGMGVEFDPRATKPALLELRNQKRAELAEQDARDQQGDVGQQGGDQGAAG